MKKYSDYMDEITPDELYEGLLKYGMFAEKLPPVFSSEYFYNYCQGLTVPFSKGAHDYICFDTMRNINIPRQLGIPNPMAYQRLCAGLRDNWGNLQSHFHNTTDMNNEKISRIHIRKKSGSKCLFEMNYKDWRNDGTPEDDYILGARYLVKSDISTCFPSIYTHSVCWALAGKAVAKTHRKNTWYNDIDKLCQNLRNGETHGIMIGPHASNLISEIILTVVDQKLSAAGWKFVRNIDDYDCFVESIEDGQRFLNELAVALREFDLPVNYKKVKIEKLPQALSEQWVRQLNAYNLIASYGKTGYKEVRAYFDLAVQLMDENENNAAILNYAIKVLNKQSLTENAKKFVVKEVMHLAVLFPYLLPLMEEYVFAPYNADVKEIEDFSNIVFKESERIGNVEGVIYAIYFSLKYNFNLKTFNVNTFSSTDNCILLLFGYLYCKKAGLVADVAVFEAKAKNIMAIEMERNWLFVYEVLGTNDLSCEWKDMKQANISFLRSEFQF